MGFPFGATLPTIQNIVPRMPLVTIEPGPALRGSISSKVHPQRGLRLLREKNIA
jgi:hypothetical protein